MTYNLTDASVTNRPSDVVLTYTLTGEPPTRNHWSASTTFISADGASIRQLGFKLVEGCWSTTYALDHTATTVWKQNNYDIQPRRTGDMWTVVFPLNALGPAGNAGWHADLDVAGLDGGTVRGRVG